MSNAKTVRLEVRLPERMMEDIRRIAPPDRGGKPNISKLVRNALQEEIRKHSTIGMVNWAQRNRERLQEVDHEWDYTAGDGVTTG